jgi:diguanylate cyclase (GGDEF)-like protein
MELIRHAFQDEPDIQQIAAIVKRDPILTAKLFQTVNSTSFGLKVEVTNISQAISTIGLNALKSTVVAIALGQYFFQEPLGNSIDAKKFCIHSLATATLMEKIAQAKGIQNDNQLYLVGLLHDLGIIALDYLGTPDYGKVLEKVESGKPVLEAEREVFDIDNRQVWQLLAKKWEFPLEIVTLFRGVGKDWRSRTTEMLVRDASRLADALGYSFMNIPTQTAIEERDVFSTLKEKTFLRIGDAVKKQVGALSSVLDLPNPELNQVNSSLLKVTHQLSAANVENIRYRREIEIRLTMLEETTRVSTGIMRTLQENAQAISFNVLEAMMEGFHVDSAFLFNGTPEKGLIGTATRCSSKGEADVEEIRLGGAQLSKRMKEAFQKSTNVKVSPETEDNELLARCLGNVSLAWYAPIIMRGNPCGLLGIGVIDGRNPKFQREEFGKVLSIIAGEVGLSLENSKLYKQMLKEARIDGLTGIINRRTIMKVLSAEFARFKRKGTPITVAIYDMDHFKSINDTRGHLAGDDYLKKMAVVLKNGHREADYIGRYGGDEFICVLPDTDTEGGYITAERIRNELLDLCRSLYKEDLGEQLTVSVGLASAHESMAHVEQLIQVADAALYKAKDLGRNKCVLFDHEKALQKV